MGQAKLRGTYEQRKAQALDEGRDKGEKQSKSTHVPSRLMAMMLGLATATSPFSTMGRRRKW